MRGTVRKETSERTGKVTWRARYSYTTETGERRHRSRNFDTRKEATAWLTARQNELRTGEYVEIVPALMRDYSERWFARMAHRVSSGTIYNYRSDYERFLSPVFGGMRLGSITATRVQQLYDDMLARDLSPVQISRVHQVLNQVMTSAINDGHARINPCTGRTLPKSRPSIPVTWSRDQLNAFLIGVSGTPLAALYHVMSLTGIRLGEALALRWEDVDLDRRRIVISATIRRTEQGTLFRGTGGKTATANRTVLMPGSLVETLRGARPESGTGYIVPGDDGSFVLPRRVQLDMRRQCERLGLPKLTPHGLRHTYATLTMAAGVPVKIIQEQLGHRTIAMTLTRYAHVTASLMETATGMLDATFDAPVRALASESRQSRTGDAAGGP